ncbi:MAG: tetratricopeptide repeat protein [Nitrospirae bacterium]|nr:tetratricopeptide repeat protein [Nitrospirota bacterium]
MRIVAAALVILLLSVSLVWAQKTPMEKAHALYFQGRMEEAIGIMKEEAGGKPDPQTYYFIGYAYYKMKKMDLAKEYFDKAYQLEPFYAPITPKEKK